MGSGTKARVLREAKRLLEAGVAGRVFPGAVGCFAYRENDAWTYATAFAGSRGRTMSSVQSDTPYDLASITKSFVAATALRMTEAERLSLDLTVGSALSDIRGGVGEPASLELLLSHRSGVAAWGGLYLDVPHEPGSPAARRWILNEASRRKGEGPPGNCEYSDLGYMLAGEMIGRRAGRGLARAVTDFVLDPLGISQKVYYAADLPSDKRSLLTRVAAATEHCDWRGRMITGEVHDENCAALGGVSGHAGLFGDAAGVARFGTELLDVYAERSTFLAKASLVHALQERGGGGSYRLGWDVKSGDTPAAGRRTSAKTFGHLGFTGTSLWCDPDRDVAVVLLTNRVHPSRANEKIRGFRPAFHDGVIAAYEG
ncbi:MAG: serine hydrolase domain-containing protein [Myxococcota bacterium]